MNLTTLSFTDPHYPARFRERLGEHAPKRLIALGSVAILSERKTGLFCSVRCPGDAVVGAYASVRELRDEGVTVVSGFHSPVEKECLRILLQGRQPIIICLARSLGKIRLPTEWRKALESGRLLLISRFEKSRRADKDTARRRNELVAALADEALIIYAEQGGGIEKLSAVIDQWGIPKLAIAKVP